MQGLPVRLCACLGLGFGVVLTGCDAGPPATSSQDAAKAPRSPSRDASEGGAVAPSVPATRSPAGNGGSYALPAPLPAPRPDPADFVDRIDNRWLPLLPGSRWTYRTTGSGGGERSVVEVTARTREVAGVRAVVVRDRVWTLDGTLVEDTWDWFAQDREGNVWYLGEDTTAYEDGKPVKEGSWETGVDGAAAGLVMPAVPKIGLAYPQEHLPGEAEDRGEVLARGVRVTVPAGSYPSTVKTADTTPLEPRLVEHKFYAPGVGVVREETVRGGREEVVLVSFEGPGGRRSR